MRALETNSEAIEEENSHLKLQIDSLRVELKDIHKEKDIASVNYSQLMEERQQLAKELGEAKKAWQEKVEARPRCESFGGFDDLGSKQFGGSDRLDGGAEFGTNKSYDRYFKREDGDVRREGRDRYGEERERKRSSSRGDEFREGENKRWLDEGESVIDSQITLPSCAAEAQGVVETYERKLGETGNGLLFPKGMLAYDTWKNGGIDDVEYFATIIAPSSELTRMRSKAVAEIKWSCRLGDQEKGTQAAKIESYALWITELTAAADKQVVAYVVGFQAPRGQKNGRAS